MKEGMILRKDAIEILLGAAMDYGLLYGQKEPRDEMIRSMIRRIEDLEPVGEPSGEVIRCKDCRYFEYDHVDLVNKIPLITAHEICNRWSDGCKTSENGYCFLAERREE